MTSPIQSKPPEPRLSFFSRITSAIAALFQRITSIFQKTVPTKQTETSPLRTDESRRSSYSSVSISPRSSDDESSPIFRSATVVQEAASKELGSFAKLRNQSLGKVAFKELQESLKQEMTQKIINRLSSGNPQLQSLEMQIELKKQAEVFLNKHFSYDNSLSTDVLVGLGNSQKVPEKQFVQILSHLLNENQDSSKPFFQALLELGFSEKYQKRNQDTFKRIVSSFTNEDYKEFLYFCKKSNLNTEKTDRLEKIMIPVFKSKPEENQYPLELELCRLLHPEMAPWIRQLSTGFKSALDYSQVQDILKFKAFENYPQLSQRALVSVTKEDVLQMFQTIAKNPETLPVDPFSKPLQTRIFQLLGSTLHAEEIPTATLIKLLEGSRVFSEFFTHLDGSLQNQFLEAIKLAGPEKIFQFENKVLQYLAIDPEKKLHFEAKVLDVFHPEMASEIKEFDRLTLSKQQLTLTKLITDFKLYPEMSKQLFDKIDQDSYMQLFSHLEKILYTIPEKSLFSQLLFDDLKTKLTSDQITQVIQKIYQARGNQFLTADFTQMSYLQESDREKIVDFLATIVKQHPEMTLEGIYLLASHPEANQAAYQKQVDLVLKIHEAFAEKGKMIDRSLIPAHLRTAPQLQKPTSLFIDVLNEQFEKACFTAYNYPLYTQDLAPQTMRNLNLQDRTRLKEEAQHIKLSIDVLQKSIEKLKHEKSNLEKFQGNMLEYIETSYFDPIQEKNVTKKSYKHLVDYKIKQQEASIEILRAIQESRNNPSMRKKQVDVLVDLGPASSRLGDCDNLDFLVMSALMYGGEFLKKIVFAKEFEVFHNFSVQKQNEFIASIKPFMKDDATIALVLFEKKFVSQEELFDVCAYKMGDKEILNESLISHLDKTQLIEFRKHLLTKHPDFKQALEIADLRLGFQGLFLKGPRNELIFNKAVIGQFHDLHLMEQVVSFIRLNYPAQIESLLYCQDRLNVLKYLNGELKGKALLQACYDQNHFNKQLVSNLKSVSELELLKQYASSASLTDKEYIQALISAKK